jgi:hypothetical protein
VVVTESDLFLNYVAGEVVAKSFFLFLFLTELRCWGEMVGGSICEIPEFQCGNEFMMVSWEKVWTGAVPNYMGRGAESIL